MALYPSTVLLKDCAAEIWADLLKMWDLLVFPIQGTPHFTTPCEEFDFKSQKLINSMHGSRKSGYLTLSKLQ